MSDPAIIATAYDGEDVYDQLWTWETAVQFAHDGYRVVVHQGEGHMSRERIQAMVDYERELVRDCFGR